MPGSSLEETSQPRPDDSPASNGGNDRVSPEDVTSNAWSAMSTIIHEVDERKIQGYKEDIDTFLVFAGLFSAVLTAFLIESYQGLQQDPMEVMVALMQQVAIQTYSYSLNAGFLNSTASPFSQPRLSFQPSVNAVRVNVLWFASLTLSLMSASFGILVKQWFREYLAGDYTSPQARLRVRHYRNPGLDKWKVFEIAAILPLLLQLSLASFFVGLCIFTADVHTTVGHTTFPLVAGWGFLFIASALAPAFSPRCPYKTTLLKSVTKAIWKLHSSLAQRLRIAYGRSNLGLRASSTKGALCSPGLQNQSPIPGKWSHKDPAYDEAVAAKTDIHDLDILITVDSIQSDDDLLRTMMDTLQQSRAPGTEYVRFALAIISHRLQDNITIPSSGFLDLLRLSKQTASTIMLPIADIFCREVKEQPLTSDMRSLEWHDWMKDCLCLLFSKTNIPIPSEANLCFSGVLADDSRCAVFFNILKTRAPDVNAFPHILKRLQGALHVMNGNDVLPVLNHLTQQYFSPGSAIAYQSFLDMLKDPEKVPTHYLQLLFDTLVSVVRNDIRELGRWTPRTLTCIIELWSMVSRRDEVLNLFQNILSRDLDSSSSYNYFWGVSMYAMGSSRGNASSSLKEEAQKTFIAVILAASHSSGQKDLQRIFKNFCWTLEDQWDRRLETWNKPRNSQKRLDPLVSCHMLLRSLSAMQEHGIPIDNHASFIHRIWRAVDDALPLVARRHIEGHSDIAKDSLRLIDSLDLSHPPEGQDRRAYLCWSQDFPESTSLFPDTLIKRLELFIAFDEDTTFSHRICRLAIVGESEPSSPDTSQPADLQDTLAGLKSTKHASDERKKLRENRLCQLQAKFGKDVEGDLEGDLSSSGGSVTSQLPDGQDTPTSPKNSVHGLQVGVIEEDGSSSARRARSATVPHGFP